MQYSEINGCRISKLTLGTVALGMDYGISNNKDRPDRKNSFDILASALKAGINTLDTARSYGDAEQLIGGFLDSEEKKPQLNIVTKFRFDPESLFNKDRLRKEVYDSLRASLRLLKLDRIPICLLHMSRSLPVDWVHELLPSILSDLKHDGLIDRGGISVDHPGEVDFFLEDEVVEAIQVPMNLFDTRLVKNGMLKRMHAKNKIVFVRSVFLQGLFFLSPDQLKGNLVKAAEYIRALQDLAEQAGMSISQLAFSYIRDMEGVSSIVFGAVNTEQVMQNAGLLDGDPVSDEIRASIRVLFDNIPEDIITPGLWSF